VDGPVEEDRFNWRIDYGTATIHPSEPTQAAFFDPASIRVLEVIYNKMKGGTYNRTELSKWSVVPESTVGQVWRRIQLNLNFMRGVSSGVDQYSAKIEERSGRA
jgi:hypothetical protein